MTVKDKMRINQNIRLSRKDAKEEWYVSSIQDISEYDFSISIPTHRQVPLVLNMGDEVKVNMITEVRRIEFETKVLGWRHDNIPLYVLAMPEEYRFVQLRQFVRIPAILDAAYAEIDDEGNLSEFMPCSCLDISGGGTRLLLKKEYPPGAGLMLRIKIPLKPDADTEIETFSRVVRTCPHQDADYFQAAVQFKGIRRRQQDLIIRYVLQKMSQQMKLR
ncbi:MAG TPA: flagellar brake domain-containing protein [Bacillota bacterium]|nr:flagellar brake domain-containing protein [Bacillota bacterium]